MLLKAALLSGDEAISAWQDWRSSADIDRMDPGSFRLLPLLYRNLVDHDVSDPLLPYLKGIYRRTWYKNQTQFHNSLPVLNTFHEAGIQTMLLKGAALTMLYYKNNGIRPMTDLDVLVRTEQAPMAIDLLTKLGWSPKNRSLERLKGALPLHRHAEVFRGNAGHHVDLHWHLLFECCYEGADDDFWNDAVSVKLRGVSTRALNPADQLLHICVHGVCLSGTPPFRWVADAMAVLDTAGSEVDWDRLVAQAQQRHLTLRLKSALCYLRDTLHAPIPPVILQRLQATRISRFERIDYRLKTRRVGLSAILLNRWFITLRHTHGFNLLQRLRALLAALRYDWQVEHKWQLPFYVIIKGLGKIKATLTILEKV